MEINLYTTMELSQMDIDTLIKEYVEYQNAENRMKINMDLIKNMLQAKLEEKGEDKHANQYGEVVLVRQKRNTFQQAIAKKYLSEAQLKECYKEQELSFVKVVSAEAKANMRF